MTCPNKLLQPSFIRRTDKRIICLLYPIIYRALYLFCRAHAKQYNSCKGLHRLRLQQKCASLSYCLLHEFHLLTASVISMFYTPLVCLAYSKTERPVLTNISHLLQKKISSTQRSEFKQSTLPLLPSTKPTKIYQNKNKQDSKFVLSESNRDLLILCTQ